MLQVWDFSSHLTALQSDAEAHHGGSTVFNQAPLFKFTGHRDEGFAIDWSPLVPGRLVTGPNVGYPFIHRHIRLQYSFLFLFLILFF